MDWKLVGTPVCCSSWQELHAKNLSNVARGLNGLGAAWKFSEFGSLGTGHSGDCPMLA
jgi:hypothetical protein